MSNDFLPFSLAAIELKFHCFELSLKFLS